MRYSTKSVTACVSLLLLALILFTSRQCADAQSEPTATKEQAKDPPWKRALKGEDAKKAEQLEKKIAQFKEAGKFAEAIAPAREALAIRIRAQGPEHWQTADAKRQLETLWLIAARSRDLQNEFSKLAKLEADADRLKEKGRYADAEPLVREALEI